MNDVFITLKRQIRESDTRLPKHIALYRVLVAAIELKKWRPGERFPTEQELAASLPLSLGTIQRAIRSLVDHGFVTRKRGAGSFVVDPQKLLENPLHCRFVDEGSFLPVYARLLSRKLIASGGIWSKGLEQNGQNVLRIDREISINREFFVLSRIYVNAHRFPSLFTRLPAEIESVNIKMLIFREYGVAVFRIEQFVKTGPLPDYACKVMRLPRGFGGMCFELMGFTRQGDVVYFQELFVPQNPYRLVVSENFSPGTWSADAARQQDTNLQPLIMQANF